MQFPILTKEEQMFLARKYKFEVWGKYDNERNVVRFCTSWATRPEAVEELCNDFIQMTKKLLVSGKHI
jgi:threonine aldolase